MQKAACCAEREGEGEEGRERERRGRIKREGRKERADLVVNDADSSNADNNDELFALLRYLLLLLRSHSSSAEPRNTRTHWSSLAPISPFADALVQLHVVQSFSVT